jgi:transposase
MCQIARTFLLQRLKESMSGDTISTTLRRELLSSYFFSPLQGKAPKDIHAILTETLGKHAPTYTTIKNWVAQFKCSNFSTCDVPCPGRPKTLTTPDIINQIHKLILEDQRISAKSIAEQMGISHEQVGSLIHEDLEMWKLSAKWVLNCLNTGQKRQWCRSSQQLRNFSFCMIQMISCYDW